jgi:hypothetical protein
MLRGAEPFANGGSKLVRRHPRVRGHHQLGDALEATRRYPLQIAGERRLEGLLRLPLRVFRRECLQPIANKEGLHRDRHLGPQRAIVVEHGDPLSFGDVVRATFARHSRNEVNDRAFGGAGVPGSKEVRCHTAFRFGSGVCLER